jgi:hypothetical protein
MHRRTRLTAPHQRHDHRENAHAARYIVGQLEQTQISPYSLSVLSVQPAGHVAWQIGGCSLTHVPLGVSQWVNGPGQSVSSTHAQWLSRPTHERWQVPTDETPMVS